MPHDFQQYTTYEQSLELKKLGAPQDVKWGSYYWWKYEHGDWNIDLFISEYANGGPVDLRAYSLQEMLHELMENYHVQLTSQKREHSIAGYARVILDREDMVFKRFDCEGEDPFPAVYAAFKWHLEQQRTSTTDTTDAS